MKLGKKNAKLELENNSNILWVVLTGTVKCPLTTQLLAAFQLFEQLLTVFGNFFLIFFDNFFTCYAC